MKTTVVIFGITGDLSRRKLLPALDRLATDNDELAIVGVSRREVDMAELLGDHPGLKNRTRIFTMDLAEAREYRRLADELQVQPDEKALMYLSVPPSASADIVEFLGQAGLNTPNVKLLFEKPFGFDLDSAKDYIERTMRYFSEEQIYRIDHYMAKEVAAEIVRLRSNAENHHHVWGNHSIRSVDIIAAETLGVAERASFYEQTGALRDFIQGHLMQLLALVLMDASNLQNTDLPLRRLKALEALEPASAAKAQRGQYEGYDQDVKNPGSLVETFVSLELESEDERWVGVRLRLVTGKKLAHKQTAIVVNYSDGATDTFDEEVIISEVGGLDAYERVLMQAIAGQKHLFTSSPEVLRSWEIVAAVQDNWALSNDAPTRYPQGAELSSLM